MFHNQHQYAEYVCLIYPVFISSDWRHAVWVPTISMTDAVSILHQFLWPSNELYSHIGVSGVLNHHVNPIFNDCHSCELVLSMRASEADH